MAIILMVAFLVFIAYKGGLLGSSEPQKPSTYSKPDGLYEDTVSKEDHE